MSGLSVVWGLYSQTVVPAKAGTQGIGVSFDKLRACPGLDPVTNGLSAYGSAR